MKRSSHHIWSISVVAARYANCHFLFELRFRLSAFSTGFDDALITGIHLNRPRHLASVASSGGTVEF
jgi:hypothetical protein